MTHKIGYQNYDLAFKEALTLFENQTLDFLGLNLPKIIRTLETEFVEVETRDEFVDLTFELEDGTILLIEEQTLLSQDDLIRFAHYALRIYKRYRVHIHMVVISPSTRCKEGANNIDLGCLKFSVIHLVIRGRNADEKLIQMKKEISEGRSINELELIFIPLMESRLSREELLLETIKLEKEITDDSIRGKVIALTLVMSNKLVESELLDKIWEEIKMLKILKYAEEKGMEKGIEKGMAIGRIEEKRLIIERLLIKKFGALSKDIQDQIHNMDSAVLDLLSLEILDLQRVEDLQRYMQKMNPR